MARTSSPKPRSKSSPLDHWWFTARPSSTSVGTDADHSLESTTASRRSRTAATTAAPVITAVTGTCPLRKPELVRAADEGIDLAGDACDRQAGRRPPRPQWRRSARPGGAHDAQCGAPGGRRDRLHRHDGVDAAAERDQGPAGPGVVGHGRRPERRRGPSRVGRAGRGRCGRRTRRGRRRSSRRGSPAPSGVVGRSPSSISGAAVVL